MKCSLKIGSALITISALVSSAALKPLSRSGDKLNLLDKQGYEVISDAEEILSPMPSEDGKDGGMEDRGTGFSPEMLLYGRFYVLQKKRTLSDSELSSRLIKPDNFLRKSHPPSAQQYLEYRSQSRSSPKSSTSTTTEKINFLHHKSPRSGIAKNSEVRSDTIFFPGDEQPSSSRTKKYLRKRKDGIIDEPKPLQTRPNRSQDKKGELIVDNLKFSEGSPLKDFDDMNSEEFVTWTKDNLNTLQISDLLNQVDPTHSNSEGSIPSPGVTPTSDIQYNSFILVPHLKCPDGERMTHRGSCAPKYVHFSTPAPHPHSARIRQRTNRGNARKKLMQLLAALKKMEVEAQKALEESTDATVSESESESTTLLSVEETNR